MNCYAIAGRVPGVVGRGSQVQHDANDGRRGLKLIDPNALDLIAAKIDTALVGGDDGVG